MPTGGKAVEPPVDLQPLPDSQARVINFGEDRHPEFASFTIVSDRPLPTDLEQRLSLVADPVTRTTSDTAETVIFREPGFSSLRPSGNRERLRFDVCLEPPATLPAGKYTGLVAVEGPPGVESTAVTFTANAKNGGAFVLGLVLALGFAFLVLLYRSADEVRAASIEAAKDRCHTDQEKAKRWTPAVWTNLKDLGWWAPTLFALGAAFGTLVALYDSDPAWGESGLTSVATLIGAGLAAVGAQAVFASRK